MEQGQDTVSLLRHLERITRLERPEIEKVLREAMAFYAESVEAYVVRRHGEMQAEGLKNEAIFDLVARELDERRFAAPALSARQLRRIVYG